MTTLFTHSVLSTQTSLLLGVTNALAGRQHRQKQRSDHDERGQATAEYALVLLGAAAIALLVVSWATKTNIVGKLLDVVFGSLLDKAPKADITR